MEQPLTNWRMEPLIKYSFLLSLLVNSVAAASQLLRESEVDSDPAGHSASMSATQLGLAFPASLSHSLQSPIPVPWDHFPK